MAYYAVSHGAEFPYNNVIAQYIQRDLDVLEAGAIVTAAVAFVMGLLHLNFDEMSLASLSLTAPHSFCAVAARIHPGWRMHVHTLSASL